MRLEFHNEGVEVEFVAINKSDATTTQHELYDRCSFPIFQDTSDPASGGVWELHDGNKDDLYIYDVNGVLAKYLPSGSEEHDITLSTPAGYAYVKGSILEVVGNKDEA
ncbi:MAG: hypothetical protein B7733_20190 [Myxococcales bacterium FL481]|nr:MAG: hypothetical protein B7733_20190 [Myxococcales bacterium FL481]